MAFGRLLRRSRTKQKGVKNHHSAGRKPAEKGRKERGKKEKGAYSEAEEAVASPEAEAAEEETPLRERLTFFLAGAGGAAGSLEGADSSLALRLEGDGEETGGWEVDSSLTRRGGGEERKRGEEEEGRRRRKREKKNEEEKKEVKRRRRAH